MHWLTLILLAMGILGCTEAPTHRGVPTPGVAETNQPNCMVGAFTMLSAEALNQATTVQFWERRIKEPTLEAGTLVWNQTFPARPLVCIYDVTDTNVTGPINLDQPYLWQGTYQDGAHVCLVYFAPSSITLKQFVYDPATKTNYSESMSYEHFFSNTLSIYTVATNAPLKNYK